MLEAFAKHLYRQQIVGATGNPAPGIDGKPTCRDEAVNVRMMGQVLRPGVQH